MALGGGIWSAQNKVLPGSYINFVSLSRASAVLSERGVATLPLMLDWGPDNEVFTVTGSEFQADSLKLFGYPYDSPQLAPLREVFLGSRMGHFYRLNSGGKKAANSYAAAKYTGTRGNALKIIVEDSENSTEEAPLFDVSTVMDSTVVDLQAGISAAQDLRDNDYVTFIPTAELAVTAGMPLSGGENGKVENEAWQTYLDKVEPYSFNVIGCPSADDTIKGLFANFTRRMRDECGVKFQCVLFRYPKANYEGVISVENGLVDAPQDPAMVYWTVGAEAGCAVNQDLTNSNYTGEYPVSTDYRQSDLEAALRGGKLIFHRVGDDVRVLEDINTFTSYTSEKNEDFSSNQVIRTLDQVGNDIAAMFNDKYNGSVPNDNAGRISLWNDIVKHHQELERLRALEGFQPDSVVVGQGDNNKTVVVTDAVQPVSAMKQLYMTVRVH